MVSYLFFQIDIYSSINFTAPASPADNSTQIIHSNSDLEKAFLGKMTQIYCGLLEQDTTNKFNILLQNNTNSTLKIIDASVTCGCVQLSEIPKIILPGQDKLLSFTMASSLKTGVLRQRIVVRTDSKDPRHSLYNIEVIASIKSAWTKPDVLNYVSTGSSNRIVGEFTLFSLGYPSAVVKSIKCDNAYYSFNVGRKISNQSYLNSSNERSISQNVKVELDKNTPIGQHSANLTIRIETDSETVTLSKQINCQLHSLVDCKPSNVFFADTVPQKEYSETIYLNNTGSQDIDMSAVKFFPTSDMITTKLKSVSKNSLSVEIFCRINSNSPRALLKEKITAKIGDQTVSVIPVIVLLKR